MSAVTGENDLAEQDFESPPADPIELLTSWLADAGERAVREPALLALATVDGQARVSSRIVRVEAVSSSTGSAGLLFTSHSSSRKGREFATTAEASGLFYWREISRQITVSGPVVPVSPDEADELWAARPLIAQAVTAASNQSARLEGDEDELRHRADELAGPGEPLPRPARWLGYRLVPTAIEFWAGAPDRIHHRLRYEQTDGHWSTSRLQP